MVADLIHSALGADASAVLDPENPPWARAHALGPTSWQAAQAQRENGPDYVTVKERMFIEELQLPPHEFGMAPTR